jgi:hypothetical protein
MLSTVSGRLASAKGADAALAVLRQWVEDAEANDDGDPGLITSNGSWRSIPETGIFGSTDGGLTGRFERGRARVA